MLIPRAGDEMIVGGVHGTFDLVPRIKKYTAIDLGYIYSWTMFEGEK